MVTGVSYEALFVIDAAAAVDDGGSNHENALTKLLLPS